jgi:glycosyltransferase involved in cell wall biosynthesis
MKPIARRMAIVCQPWDAPASQTAGSIVHIAYQLALHIAGDWHVTVYGRREPGQKPWEACSSSIEFKRLTVLQKPQSRIVDLLSIISCYMKRRIPYMLSYAYHPLYAIRVAMSIRRGRYDAILVINFPQFASLIRFFNRSAAICLYMQCEWLTQFATAATERRLRRVDLIIGCSNYITDKIKARFPAIAARCYTVYNGVDIDRFYPAPNARVRCENAQRLLFVARLSPEKGIHVLIKAFKLLAESRPDLRLDLVGYPGLLPYLYLDLNPDLKDAAICSLNSFYGYRISEMVRRQLFLRGRAYLADLTAEAIGQERIVFHGVVTQLDTVDFYRRATVLVLPSVWHEPFGIPAIEASACGLPVVATCSGGIPEIIEHRGTGMLVARGEARELARAIAQVLDNPDIARVLGEAGRQLAIERFAWNVVSQQLVGLIESVLAARLVLEPRAAGSAQ